MCEIQINANLAGCILFLILLHLQVLILFSLKLLQGSSGLKGGSADVKKCRYFTEMCLSLLFVAFV